MSKKAQEQKWRSKKRLKKLNPSAYVKSSYKLERPAKWRGLKRELPPTLRKTFYACLVYTVAPAATSLNMQLKLNDLFDPTGGLGAIVPAGVAEMDDLYDRYWVYAGKVHCKYLPTVNANAGYVGQALRISREADVSANWQDEATRRETKTMINPMTFNSQDQDPIKGLGMSWTYQSVMGRRKPADEDKIPQFGASPAAGETIYANFYLENLTTADNLTGKAVFYITFEAELSDRELFVQG